MPQWVVGYHEADSLNEVETELSKVLSLSLSLSLSPSLCEVYHFLTFMSHMCRKRAL